MSNHAQAKETELIIALDFQRADPALELVNELSGIPVIYKVGFEMFLAGGPDFVRELVHRKNRVFLDLKLHDIPNTVARAAKQAALLHVEMLTVHLVGGSAMLKAVGEAFSDIPTLRPKILGVTVLTSFNDVKWAEVTKSLTGHAVDVDDSVSGLVAHASAWGADGIVCSALDLPSVKTQAPSLYTVIPGIRPEGVETHDQARVMTPLQARQAGAGAIVMGRPITESSTPKKVVEKTLRDLS